MEKSKSTKYPYMESIKEQLMEFTSLSKSNPNDMQFGRECRNLLPKDMSLRIHPNDEDLGRHIRKCLVRISVSKTELI